MTTSSITVVLAAGAGALLGGVFYGGLWWTARRGLSAGQPALWFVASLLVRVGIVLAGMYLVAGGHPDRLLSCVLGFVMAHIGVTWWSRATRGGSVGHGPQP